MRRTIPRSGSVALVAVLAGLAVSGPAGAQFTCPPIATCFPKPFPILDAASLADVVSALTYARQLLTLATTAANLVNQTKASFGSLTTPTLQLNGIAQASINFAPSFLTGMGGNYQANTATVTNTYGAPYTASSTGQAPAPSQAAGAYQQMASTMTTQATRDAMAMALARKAALPAANATHAALVQQASLPQSVRDDFAFNTRVRLAVADQFNILAEIMITSIALDAADASQRTQPKAGSDLTVNTTLPLNSTGSSSTTAAMTTLNSDVSAAVALHDARANAATLSEASTAVQSANSTYEAISAATAADEQALVARLASVYSNPAQAWAAIKAALVQSMPSTPVNLSTLSFDDATAFTQGGQQQITASWQTTVTTVDGVFQTMSSAPGTYGTPLAPNQQTPLAAADQQTLMTWAADYENSLYYGALLPNATAASQDLATTDAQIAQTYGLTTLTGTPALKAEQQDIATAQALMATIPATSAATTSQAQTLQALVADPNANQIITFTP